MKPVILGFAAALALSSAAYALTGESPLMPPLHQFLDGFNKGDMAAAAAAHGADVVIVDEVAPHIWRGPKAFEAWATDLEADAKKTGKTESAVTLGKTLRSVTSGSHGYVVVQVVYTYKEKGVSMREPAEMTFSLQNGKDGWKISSWAWDGTVPRKVPPTATAIPPK